MPTGTDVPGSPIPVQDASASSVVALLQSWAPSKVLLEKFIKEIRFAPVAGVPGSGPQGKDLESDRDQERLDPLHLYKDDPRNNTTLEKAVQLVVRFVALAGGKANASTFSKWLDELSLDDRKIVLKLIKSWKSTLGNPRLVEDMVRYLDMERRQQYHIEPRSDGLFYYREAYTSYLSFQWAPFDTSRGLATMNDRPDGHAIWVQAPSGRFYSSPDQETGKFHHSSFLAGRAVKAAGDWKIQEGKLKLISALSGHYHPKLESLRRALLDLQATSRQLLTWGCEVEVYKNGSPHNIPVRQFLDNAAKDKNYLDGFTPSD
jgi:hypothetical protein